MLGSILAGTMKGGQGKGKGAGFRGKEDFEVVAVTLFGKMVVASYPTLEQAEWRARELNEEAERSPGAIAVHGASRREVANGRTTRIVDVRTLDLNMTAAIG